MKPYDPFEETKQVIEEFNSLVGEDAIWCPGVYGLRLEDTKVSLTRGGRDYIWMDLNDHCVSMVHHTPQWIMEWVEKCNNVYDMAKVFGPLVMSESNIDRALNWQETESESQMQTLRLSRGPRMH